MKKLFFPSTILTTVLLSLSLISLWLTSGCMMIGMHGMGDTGMTHGGTHSEETQQQKIIVKESIANGIKITAEFPPYTLADELVYKVTVYDNRDKLFISDASISLIVKKDDSREEDIHSKHGQIHEMKFLPDEINNGTYSFRPSIDNPGTYKFIFILEKIGDYEIDPPIEVEQTVRLLSQMDQHLEEGDTTWRPWISPVVLIGAGIMAVIMILMLS